MRRPPLARGAGRRRPRDGAAGLRPDLSDAQEFARIRSTVRLVRASPRSQEPLADLLSLQPDPMAFRDHVSMTVSNGNSSLAVRRVRLSLRFYDRPAGRAARTLLKGVTSDITVVVPPGQSRGLTTAAGGAFPSGYADAEVRPLLVLPQG